MAEKNCENCSREDCAFIPPAGDVHCGYWKSDTPAVNRWIPCSERLPYIGVDVIVYVRTWREHKVQFGYRYSEETWSVANVGVPNDEITHWMPLPEPPKE